MTGDGYALFDTPVGRCGIVWSERGVTGVQLPNGGESATRRGLVRRFPDVPESVPPEPVRRAVDGIVALLRGEACDLCAVELDLDGVPDFERRVYEIARSIPPGKTLTYGEIAVRLGEPGAAREVGRALGRNPVPLVVPCHRVVAADGTLGGFSAHGGTAAKRRLLEIEGALPPETGWLFDDH